jgi:lipoprotein-releasing system permease protein
VLALITVLSVMNGFESELRTRLLSLSAHATLTAAASRRRRSGGLAQPLQELEGAPGLTGAAPFLDTDAMLSHPPAMGGAIVRGIDPALEPKVSIHRGAMREGKLSDLAAG